LTPEINYGSFSVDFLIRDEFVPLSDSSFRFNEALAADAGIVGGYSSFFSKIMNIVQSFVLMPLSDSQDNNDEVELKLIIREC
jgi:hypothetical protein